jgi:hypothetical protein
MIKKKNGNAVVVHDYKFVTKAIVDGLPGHPTARPSMHQSSSCFLPRPEFIICSTLDCRAITLGTNPKDEIFGNNLEFR